MARSAHSYAHLTKLHTEPRRVPCDSCGKKISIVGPRTLPLCDVHRREHLENQKRKLANRAKDRRLRNKTKGKSRPVQRVRRNDHTSRAIPNPPLQLAPETLQPAPSVQTSAVVAAAPTRQAKGRGSFEDALKLITQPESRREGLRHGWIGNTGSGKTTALREFLKVPSDRLVLIHDDTKLDAQYPGSVVRKFEEAPDDATQIVFRGDVFTGVTVEPEDVSALGVAIARHTRQPVRVVIDELDRCCSPGGKELSSPSTRVILTQGRALGVSLLWSTQTPQRMPREVIDQSSTIAIQQLGPRALNYLDERLCFDKELLDVVPDLPVGDFVIYEQGKRWNGIVYGTPGLSG